MKALDVFVGIAIVCLIVRYYWLRIIACGLLLVLWGAVAVVAPLVATYSMLRDGNIVPALLTVAVGVFIGFFWYIGLEAALRWVKDQRARGAFWLRWNAH